MFWLLSIWRALLEYTTSVFRSTANFRFVKLLDRYATTDAIITSKLTIGQGGSPPTPSIVEVVEHDGGGFRLGCTPLFHTLVKWWDQVLHFMPDLGDNEGLAALVKAFSRTALIATIISLMIISLILMLKFQNPRYMLQEEVVAFLSEVESGKGKGSSDHVAFLQYNIETITTTTSGTKASKDDVAPIDSSQNDSSGHYPNPPLPTLQPVTNRASISNDISDYNSCPNKMIDSNPETVRLLSQSTTDPSGLRQQPQVLTNIYAIPHTDMQFSDGLKLDLRNNENPLIMNDSEDENVFVRDISKNIVDIVQPPFVLKSARAKVDNVSTDILRLGSRTRTSSGGRLPVIAFGSTSQAKVTPIQVINRSLVSGGSENSVQIIAEEANTKSKLIGHQEPDDTSIYTKSSIYENFTKRRGSSISTKISRVSNSIDKYVLSCQILDLLNNETTGRETFEDFFTSSIEDYSSMNLDIDLYNAFLNADSITVDLIESKCNEIFVLNIPGNNYEMNQIKFIGELRFFITNEYNGSDKKIINLIRTYHEFVDKSFPKFIEILHSLKYQETKSILHLVLLIRDFISIYDASSAIVGSNDLTRCLSLLFDIVELNESLKDVIYNSLLSIVSCLSLKSFKVSFLPLMNQLFKTQEIQFKKQFISLDCICYYMCLNRAAILEEFNRTKAYESKIECCGYKLIQNIHENVKHIKSIIEVNKMEEDSLNSRLKSSIFSFVYKLIDLYLVIVEVFLKSNQIPSVTQVELLTTYINDIYNEVKDMASFDSRILEPPQVMDFI